MQRGILLGLMAVCIFVVIAAVMLKFMPAPLKESDYVVVGSVATLVALLVLFVVLLSTSMKTSEIFFKRRKK